MSSTTLQPQSAMASVIHPQASQPSVVNDQFISGGMQGQFYNSSLCVQPQTTQQPVGLPPSKPVTSVGNTTSGLPGESTPLHQVAKVNKVLLMCYDKSDISMGCTAGGLYMGKLVQLQLKRFGRSYSIRLFVYTVEPRLS